jgi:hypothetical protein
MIVAHRQHADARSAIREACARAPAVVGWKPGGWLVYSATDGAPDGVEPELLALAPGRLPVALSDTGAAVLLSALCAAAGEADHG